MDKELKARIQENKVLTFQERKNIIRDLKKLEKNSKKLEKIEQIVKEWENSKIVTNCYKCAEQIKEVLEQE